MLSDLTWTLFLTITTLHLVAVACPGPDFVLVTRESLRHGRRSGLLCSAGIACGIPIHIAYCILGLTFLLTSSAMALAIFQSAAATYLIFLGLMAIRQRRTGSKQPADVPIERKHSVSFLLGLLTNLLNPKAALFFLAVFTAVIGPDISVVTQIFLGLWMAFITFLWFAAVTTLLTTERARSAFLNQTRVLDVCSGIIFLLFGLGLLLQRHL